MAGQEQFAFVALLARHMPWYFRDAKVLEIGSLDINGSVRSYFSNCEYIGIDISPGKGVDVVCQGQDYQGPPGSFDHVISCECMEHNPFWRETFNNMVRLCRPGGLITMTCATLGRAEHGTARTSPSSSPLTVSLGWNYYKNRTPSDFKSCIDMDISFEKYRFWIDWDGSNLFFAGIRSSRDGSKNEEAWSSFEKEATILVDSANAAVVTRMRQVVGTIFGDPGLALSHRIGKLVGRHRTR